jgi:hypothetical protein
VVMDAVQTFHSARLPPEDRFVQSMKPFVHTAGSQVEALTKMANSVDTSLKGVLEYFGESSVGTDAMKPEDLFGTIASFSAVLQVFSYHAMLCMQTD